MDILKIFVSTLVVLCITAIVFFGLYFLFPSLSDSVFGVSYLHGCTIDGVEERAAVKATMDDMKSGIRDTMKGAAESVSDVAASAVATVKDVLPKAADTVKDMVPDAVEAVKDTDASEVLDAAVDKVQEIAENVDVEKVAETLTEAEEAVVEFFSSGNGDRFLSELKKEDIIPDDFDISKAADSAEGKEIIRNISSYVKESGVDLVDALSNSRLHKMISGKADETLDALKGLFAGGLK